LGQKDEAKNILTEELAIVARILGESSPLFARAYAEDRKLLSLS
jgi:hypothetical protein